MLREGRIISLHIDTKTIRRLRDVLIENGQLVLRETGPTHNHELDARQLASLKRVSHFAETMYLMMVADGDIAKEEQDAIRGALSMLTVGCIDSFMLDTMLHDFAKQAQEQGVAYRLQTIGAQLSGNREDRETAFTLAAAVAMADRELANSESNLIENISEWYGISGKRVAEILESIDRKN